VVNLIITDTDASRRRRTGNGPLPMGLSWNQPRGVVVVSDNRQGKANQKAPSKDTSLASAGTRTLSNIEQCSCLIISSDCLWLMFDVLLYSINRS